MVELILASGSPRRRQMLNDLGLRFHVSAPEIDEKRLRGEPAREYVQRLAFQKANSVFGRKVKPHSTESSIVILAADTTVVYGSMVLNKPENADDALKMLRKLSGRTHEVLTGFCWKGVVRGKEAMALRLVSTKVTFAERDTGFWKWYISTGEPMDKAGAYAAQGIGMSFIEKVSGSYSNVIGLPLPQVVETYEKTFKGSLREDCGAVR